MKWISYSRFSEEDLGVDVEDLLKALSDFLLESGFQDPYMQFSEMNQHTLENLKQAIEKALQSGEMFDQERAEEIRQRLQQMSAQQREKLMQRLIEKLEESGYINTEGSPRVAWQIEFWGTRHTRAGNGHRLQRRLQAIQLWRHDEPGYQRDSILRDATRRSEAAAGTGVFRLTRASGRVSEFLRYGADARLQPQHDPIWRRSFHAGQESGDGVVAFDPYTVPGRFAALRSVPRLSRGSSRFGTGARASWAVLHQHTRRPHSCAEAAGGREEGHEADHHDHGWQAFCTDSRRWADLQECLRSGPAGVEPD